MLISTTQKNENGALTHEIHQNNHDELSQVGGGDIVNNNSNVTSQNPPLWNNPILYLINIHILVCLHAFSWWALSQSVDHPLRKHIITQPLSFIHKTITTIPETIMIPTINNHNISVIISEYFPSDETVICTSFLAGPLFGFVIIPMIDYFYNGKEYVYMNQEHDKKEIDSQTRDYSTLYRMVPIIYTISLTCLFFYSLSRVHLLTAEQFLMHSISLGVALGQSGAVSHDLLHKRTFIENLCARIILIFHGYLHFPLEHVYSHHKKAATPQDAATARFGENLYNFAVRSCIGGYMNAWHIDTEHRERRRRRFNTTLPSLLFSEMFWSTVSLVLFASFVFYKFGTLGLSSYLLTALIAIILIECVNYIEHYGLKRKLRDDGEYEPVNETHSFDALFRMSSYAYFNIVFHADHHFYATREYYKLRVYEKSPKLPFGYSTMILISFIPPLYFSLMNPIVFEFYRDRGVDYEKLLNQE
ncbi:predicted protein [Naegleria gruberi]|uniref:Predicted protein n=1 Tax=Naegleria gruberi TaxID=5762 RepID=D2VK76_NAEGR|nr:uncharacterized protein NAEGRDRAFT_80273 [Naegleria gruberi]EFC42900.1 predicted protein [Naegleria gruberi]|eukprot:XP_002675644.1 predicted protein [Naegleria gruberi strain NEG-M]